MVIMTSSVTRVSLCCVTGLEHSGVVFRWVLDLCQRLGFRTHRGVCNGGVRHDCPSSLRSTSCILPEFSVDCEPRNTGGAAVRPPSYIEVLLDDGFICFTPSISGAGCFKNRHSPGKMGEVCFRRFRRRHFPPCTGSLSSCTMFFLGLGWMPMSGFWFRERVGAPRPECLEELPRGIAVENGDSRVQGLRQRSFSSPDPTSPPPLISMNHVAFNCC